jgi:hypothetical protein
VYDGSFTVCAFQQQAKKFKRPVCIMLLVVVFTCGVCLFLYRKNASSRLGYALSK